MSRRPPTSRTVLAWVLSVTFAVAIFMGPGPGVYLVNPAGGGARPAPTFLGLPVLYVWALFWFLVEAVIVLAAYLVFWRRDEEHS